MTPVEPTPEAVEAVAEVIVGADPENPSRAENWLLEARAVLAFLAKHPEYVPGLKVQRRTRCSGCGSVSTSTDGLIWAHFMHEEGAGTDVVRERRVVGPWQEVPDGD